MLLRYLRAFNIPWRDLTRTIRRLSMAHNLFLPFTSNRYKRVWFSRFATILFSLVWSRKKRKEKKNKKKKNETLRVDCYYLNLCDCRQNTHIHTNDWLQINLFYIFNCLIISWHFRYPLSVHTRIAWIIQFSISYFHQHAYSNTFYLFLMIFGRKGIAQS